MSRKQPRPQQQFAKTPRIKLLQKKKQRRESTSSESSLSDLSSDNGYSAVDDISDDEDDDEDGVDTAEAVQHIVTWEKENLDGAASPQPDDEDDYEGDGEDDGDVPPTDDEADQDMDQIDSSSSSSSSSSSIVTDSPEPSPVTTAPPVKRQVRFAGIPDSDSDSTTSETEHDNDFYPDIFVDQTSLDPAFRREIERDMEDDNSSNDSYWDFRGTVSGNGFFFGNEVSEDDATPIGSQAATAASSPVMSVEDLDDYSSAGDTTDEEEVPAPSPRKKQVRRVRPSAGKSDSDSDQAASATPQPSRPRTQRFDLSSSGHKPVAVMHPRTGRVVIFTPNQSRNFSLAPETFQGFHMLDHAEPESSPILSHSGSLMFSAMLPSNTFGGIMDAQSVGPMEAFFPSVYSDNIMDDDSDYSGLAGDSEPDDEDLNIDDFLDMDGVTSDEDQGDATSGVPFSDDEGTEGGPTPSRRASTATSATNEVDDQVHPLFAHFDGNADAVGAFRLNQVTQRMISSDQASTESLAFSGPYSMGTLKGIKRGSLETVTAPITPVRKARRPSTNEYNRSPLETMAQKRKASSTVSDVNHKRHRSISDVKNLEL